VLPDKIVNLTKKNQKSLLKRNTFNLNCAIDYLMQVMYQFYSKNTIPSRHKHIQPFPFKLHKSDT